MPVKCPICKKDDAIQKLSSIVDASTSNTFGSFSGPTGGIVNVDGKWGYSGGYTTLYGSQTSKTQLAERLAPVREPILKKGLGGWWILIILGGFLIVPLIGLLCSSSNMESPSSIFIIITILYIGMFILVEGNKRQKNESIYLEEKKEYEKYLNVWKKIYYCFRDDVIFDPESGIINEIEKPKVPEKKIDWGSP